MFPKNHDSSTFIFFDTQRQVGGDPLLSIDEVHQISQINRLKQLFMQNICIQNDKNMYGV